MGKHAIQCFRHATYHTFFFNMTCEGECECNGTPALSTYFLKKRVTTIRFYLIHDFHWGMGWHYNYIKYSIFGHEVYLALPITKAIYVAIKEIYHYLQDFHQDIHLYCELKNPRFVQLVSMDWNLDCNQVRNSPL